MRKSIILVFLVLLVFALPAQEIERAKSNLPEISEVISVLDEATGWVLQDNGGWLSAKNKILNFNSEQNRSADPMHGLGHQNFEQLELHEVLIGDEQYIVLIIKSAGGYFEFPALRQDFHKTRDARYIVFHAKKLEEILATANTFNEPIAINLDVFCSDNIIDYDKKQLTTQIAYNILRVQKMEEPSKFTMIFAIMPVIINGEKSFRFRYLNLFNQESIYKKYLLPANKNKHFEQSYFEVPFQRFIDFFGAVSVYNSDFDLKEPKNFNGYYKRGVLRFERENYEGALSDFREAIKQKPDNDFWILYAIMGSTQHKMKNYNAAIRSFEKAIILKPKDDMQMKAWSRNYYNRGLSFLMLNKKMDACKDFQQAKLLGISDKEALKVIKKNCRGKYKPN